MPIVGGRPARSGASAFVELARAAARERRWGRHAIHRLERAPGLYAPAAVEAVLADPPPVAGPPDPNWPADFLTPPDAVTVDQLHEIDADAALRVLDYLLTHDLAYTVAAAPPDRAGELAVRCQQLVSGLSKLIRPARCVGAGERPTHWTRTVPRWQYWLWTPPSWPCPARTATVRRCGSC